MPNYILVSKFELLLLQTSQINFAKTLAGAKATKEIAGSLPRSAADVPESEDQFTEEQSWWV